MTKRKPKPRRIQAQPPPTQPGPVQPAQAQPSGPVVAAAGSGFPPPDRPAVVPLIERIEQLRGRRLLVYYLDERGNIAGDVVRSIYLQLEAMGRQGELDLWIHSTGGQTEIPWRIVQMVREFSDTFAVLVTEFAMSAATHICLGADEIVMGPASVLGPVDPQRQHPLLPRTRDPVTGAEAAVPISVQDLRHAVEFIKREAGEEGLSAEGYAAIITALFDKVHPLSVGAIEQTYALAKLITKRMLSTHMDAEAEAQEIDRLADALSDDFMSHAFPIGRRDAKELGLKVTDAPDDLYAAMWDLLRHYDEIDRAPKPLPAGTQAVGPGGPANVSFYLIGHVDTTDQRFDCVAFEQTVGQKTEVRGSQWMRVGP